MEAAKITSKRKKSVGKKAIQQALEGLHVASECAHCGADDVKSKTREISKPAWHALAEWGEIEQSTIAKPICSPCYDDLREVLIDRADEISIYASQHKIAS